MYISSASVKHQKIKDSIEELVGYGFKDIELSGGTKYYQGYEEDLVELKTKYGLNYLLHNYFPPPKEDFILNLASLNDEIYQRTLEHYRSALVLSRKLGAKKFGMHAGYYIDFSAQETGQKISLTKVSEKDKAIQRFCDGLKQLKKDAKGDIEIYLENNVLSHTNFMTFGGQNPFMLTDHEGYLELKRHIDFKLLLDVAHLNVSLKSLDLNFLDQLTKIFSASDYIHLSDNDGLHDQNSCFKSTSGLLKILKSFDFGSKTVTVETYGSILDIKDSYSLLKESLCLN